MDMHTYKDNIRILCSGQDTEISMQNYDLLGTKFGFRSYHRFCSSQIYVLNKFTLKIRFAKCWTGEGKNTPFENFIH